MFVKTTAGKAASLSQTTVNGCGGFAGALGGTTGGGLVKAYTLGHGTLLATFTLPACTVSSNVYTMTGTPPTVTPSGNGVAVIYDLCKSDGTVLGSGTVGVTGSGADCVFDSVTFATSSNVTLSTFSHTE